MTGEQPDRPLLRVVSGDPTPEELAALTVVLAAMASGPAEPPRTPRPVWRDRARLTRQPLRPGPDAWRATARGRPF